MSETEKEAEEKPKKKGKIFGDPCCEVEM